MKSYKKEKKYQKKLIRIKEERVEELIKLFKGKYKKPTVEKKIPKKEEEKKPESFLDKAKGAAVTAGRAITSTAKKTVETIKNVGSKAVSVVKKAGPTAAAVTIGAGVGGGAITIGNIIAKGESANAGGYNAANRGTKGGKIVPVSEPQNLTGMTVGEIMQRQSIKFGSRDEDKKLFAVGKYQVIPDTLKDAVKELKIDPSEKFTPELQERIFKDYLITKKRPAIAKYLNSPTEDPKLLKEAIKATSLEWASVADPDKTGTQSHYGSGNKASISVKELGEALKQEREKKFSENSKSQPAPQPAPATTQSKIPERITPTQNVGGGNSVAVLNNTTNVINGGVTYGASEENHDRPAFIEKQYNYS
jgi:hypothetical protein